MDQATGEQPSEQDSEQKQAPKTKAYPLSIYLNDDERRQLETIAAELGWKRHKLLQEAVRYFMREYVAGRLKTRKVVVTTTELD